MKETQDHFCLPVANGLERWSRSRCPHHQSLRALYIYEAALTPHAAATTNHTSSSCPPPSGRASETMSGLR